jgi:tRNA nucleotidyltransferase (CCA-adding enzyme)
MTAREHGNVHRALELKPSTIVKLCERCDAFRKPARFAQMLLASECDYRGRGDARHEMRSRPYPQAARLLTALEAARAVNAGEIAARHPGDTEKIPEAIHAARVHAVKEVLQDPRY